ncbi:MAG: UDP-glucose/GDP-mannose dehydrogenase family protein [Simkaniaceae bacterium]|nr:UDP-glucose/GDP-mannose dehydrogenase family protein [Candidatus Sacchlamyda saccharinae]
MKQVTIIGTGYVGLVTGACLAEMGNQVTCLDVDESKIDQLLSGIVPFFEPGLEELVKRGVNAKRLCFTTSYSDALKGAELCFLALPTPSNEDGSCDYQYVFAAAESLAKHMEEGILVINKSTIPVGTTEKVRQKLLRALGGRGIEFDVVSNPEFLQEGSAVYNCMNPDRIILGVENTHSQAILEQLYAPFKEKIQVMDIASAELSKYAANGMLALRLSYMNHLAGLCEKVGADIDRVRVAIGADPRIGKKYLQPGVGFGGSCLPKDVDALCAIAEDHGHSSAFFRMILEINEAQKWAFFEKIAGYFGSLEGKTFAIWGLSFKPNTDDLREAPSLTLISMLRENGAQLRLFDPVSMEQAKKQIEEADQLTFCQDEYDAAKGADAILLITEWPEFQSVDFQKIRALMRNQVVFDGRNLYKASEMQQLGFEYHCIGKPSIQVNACTT